MIANSSTLTQVSRRDSRNGEEEKEEIGLARKTASLGQREEKLPEMIKS